MSDRAIGAGFAYSSGTSHPHGRQEETPSLPEQTAQLLGNRYRLLDPIAKGGMAVVWRAKDERLDRAVAVKVLHTRLAGDENFRERFRREAVAAASFNHPNIVTVFDTGEEGDTHFIVMELVEGPSLSRLLGPKGTLTPAECVTLLRSVLSALAYSHERGVIHRDVKPANILIAPKPAPGVIKVGDFGIARALAATELTATGAIIGTASYLSPEQAEGKKVDHRADVYSLACVGYRALTGRLPWTADSEVGVALARTLRPPEALRPLCPQAPKRLVHVIEAALARDPAARYQSAAEMAAALGNLRGAHIAVSGRTRKEQPESGSSTSRPSSPTPVSPLVSAMTPPGAQAVHIGELPEPRDAPAAANRAPAVRRQEDPPGQATQRPRHRATREPERQGATVPGRGGEAAVRRRAVARERAAKQAQRRLRARRTAVVAAAVGFLLVVLLLAIPTGRKDDVPPTTAPSEPLPIIDAFNFDPEGDEAENPRTVPNAFDGDSGTAWRTERYNSRDLGGLKDGVGVAFDLGAAVAPGTVTVTITPGTSLELRTSDDPDADMDSWRLVPGSASKDVESASPDVPAVVRIDTGEVTAQYWLVWITRLASPSKCCSTEVFEVAFGA